MLSFPMLPHCRQGKFIWLRQVPARPLQQGLELCSLLGDRQPGPFPLLFQKAPHKPWQQLRRSRRHSQTAGRSKPDDGDTCPLQASQCQARGTVVNPLSPSRAQHSELPAHLTES